MYCGTHIPNLATVSEPLWALVKSKDPFKWREEHSEALKMLRESIIKFALAPFRRSWHTEVIVDASPVGIGVVVGQVDPANKHNRVIVRCASRLLSDTERRYSQVEKEGLAAVWGCERMKLLLLGKDFKLITDNRAIELILRIPKSRPPARIERWNLRLCDFRYTVEHRPGKYNLADYISRHPAGKPSRGDQETDEFIAFVTDHALPRSITKQDICQAIEEDETMVILREAIKADKLSEDPRLARFKQVWQELAVDKDGIVLRGRLIILPLGLRKRAIQIAHEGHLGVSKTKSLMRTKTWFPCMDKAIEDAIGKCEACQVETVTPPPPTIPSEMPKGPWRELCIDFFGPVPGGGELMVVIDEFSRMPYVKWIKSVSASNVIPKLDELFSFVGIPEVLKSDNGPPFNGSEFKDFAQYLGFRHRKITPEHPMANGMAEGFMKSLGKMIRCAIAEKKNWRGELNKFLRNYRGAPHASTGVPPAVLMFGENRTSRLLPNREQRKRKQVEREANEKDTAAKEKARQFNDKRRKVKPTNLKIGDIVWLKRKTRTKFESKYDQTRLRVTKVKGYMVTVQDDATGWSTTRNVSKFKIATALQENEDPEIPICPEPEAEEISQAEQESAEDNFEEHDQIAEPSTSSEQFAEQHQQVATPTRVEEPKGRTSSRATKNPNPNYKVTRAYNKRGGV